MDSTLESVDRAEELAIQLAESAGVDEDDLMKIGMAVRESMVNAVVHGNRYNARKKVHLKVSRTPERFGQGAIEGVAAPESANNAAAQACFIPMLSLGIPPNALMALMIGAMMIHGIQPGPNIITKQPELFWGLIASMWIGNAMLVILNLPLIGIWVRLLQVPYGYLFPTILVFCCIGTYALNSSTGEVLIMTAFGVVGYVFRKLDCEPAPLLLGLVLGPLLEENFRRALQLTGGDWSVFVTRPLSLAFLVAALALLVAVTLPGIRRGREEAFRE